MSQHNELRTALEAGDAVVGARAVTMSPVLVEVYGELGFDFVWLDFEHTGRSPFDSTVLEHLDRAADAAGIEPLVRLPSGDPALVRKALDTGIRTVLVPRVESPSDLRAAVRASRFGYDGEAGTRGVATSRAGTWGSGGDDYVTREDESTLVGAMIETAAGVERLDELLAVPELGFVFIGPGDLSVSLGHPLETDHPEVREAVERIRDACHAADVPLGGVASDASAATTALTEGYRLVRLGGEVGAARELLGEQLTEVRPSD